MVTHIQAKAFAGTHGGGEILKKCFLISIYFNVKLIILPKKGYFHMCPRMDFLQTLHINNSLYTNYENVFIELDS